MTRFDFGQPLQGIIQMAYIVEDLQPAMTSWTRDLRAGPWFVFERFTGIDPVYRGNPSRAEVAIALGFAGHMQIELIQPLNDQPSVYREVREQRGFGFHHFGVASHDFEADLARFTDQGSDLVFHARVPLGGLRVAYMDTRSTLPGMLELIEMSAELETVFTRMYHASVGWDGGDPVRSSALL